MAINVGSNFTVRAKSDINIQKDESDNARGDVKVFDRSNRRRALDREQPLAGLTILRGRK